VTYVGNGNDGGTAPVDNNRYNDSTMVTVKGKGTLTRTKAAFIGWSFSTSGLITAKTDEPSDLMKPDTAIRITSDLTFHAVWAEDKNNNGVADYDEVDITWHPGVQVRAGRPKVETVSKGDLLLTSKGFAVNGYVLIGWSPRRNRVVMSQAAENSLSPLYKVGGHFTASVNTTLYAVWALDKNGNGIPDYQEEAKPVRLDTEYVNKLLSDLEAKRRAEEASGSRRNLRAAAVSLPKWNIKDDIAAYKENVFFVGCTYNEDTTSTHEILEPLIAFYGENSFPGYGSHNITAARDMELVFNYGGVLEDTCLVGGKGRPQKALSRIPFPKPVSGDTLVVKDLFSRDPMTFTRIKEDGDAVLKMYFVKKKTGKGPDTLANSGAGNDTSYFRVIGPSSYPSVSFKGQGKPFIDQETGEYVDTLTFQFQIFNQPEFAATTIRSRVSYGDTMRLNYGHLRGTPLKYMMRSLDGGWNWHPADSPLTDVERDLLQDDSVRVCLRQLDKAVGYAAYVKEKFMDPERYTYQNFLAREGVTPEDVGWYATYMEYTYNKEIYDKVAASYLPLNLRDTVIHYYDSLMSSPTAWADDFGGDITLEMASGFRQVADDIFLWNQTYQLYPHLIAAGYDTTVERTTEAVGRRDINTVFGKRKADAVAVPERCREESYCFYVKRDAPPVHQRSVFIPTVEGVTVVSPGVGYTSIPSQKNFTFRVKYTGEPMTVTAKRLIDGRTVEVLTGTLNADGEYEYVIRRVMQDLTLEFTKTVANTLVDQPSVWANSGAVRIHAPKETTVRIYSASGVLVKQATVQGDKTVPLSAGLYLVVLSDGTTQKVLVQ
jgi:hypothetical protein